MNDSFRKSMAWLHTWAGVVVGSVLFAIFWMGTLSVFDREIDRWMQPGTRLAPATQPVSLDRALASIAPTLPAHADAWRFDLPTEREPVLSLAYRDAQQASVVRLLDPSTYRLIPDQGSLGGTGFIFPFHFSLHIKWMNLGEWLVGFAAMAMLVLLVSGVVIHKKLFAEFFVFRPQKRLQRSSLDLHNLTGVLGLPFHFVITLSGLIVFMAVYFPLAPWAAYGGGSIASAAYTAEAQGRYTRAKANRSGTLASLDAMLAQAEHEWGGGRAYLVRVWHPGDAGSYVELRRSFAHDITLNRDQIYFDAATGAVLHRFAAAPVMTVQRFISGLHLIQFEHWTLRWLYFLAGLAGSVMIATGFIFWLEARRARHALKRLAGVRLVEGLTIGSISGIVIATLAFLVANRLLPLGLANRAGWEMGAFYLAWIASFAHAWWRPGPAWREQALAVVVLAILAVALNALTTGDHLLRTLGHGQWAVAGLDLMLLATAIAAAVAARRLATRAKNGKQTHTPAIAVGERSSLPQETPNA